MSEAREITVNIPGEPRTLTMHHPEWARLPAGWQLGGWVDHQDAETVDTLYTTDRVMLTHPGQSPVYVSLRTRVDPSGTYRGGSRTYLKLQAVHAPRPHPAWELDG